MLDGKVCIVAGGGQGLGRAVAAELGALGASVVVNDLGTGMEGEGESEEPARETAREIRDAGGDAMAHFGDVTSLDYTDELVSDAVEEYGRVDGAVNFAGVLSDAISWKMTGEEWDRVIRVHLRGHFALLRPLAERWRGRAREEGGELGSQRSFLGVSSASAFGSVGQLNYATAKAGVLGFVRTAAMELGRFGVRVNALIPTAYTRTVESIPDEKQPFDEDEMPPEKVAPVVAYLLGDEAEDISGRAVRAAGDMVGLVSDPELSRAGYRDGGWTAERIAGEFRDSIAAGEDLDGSRLPSVPPY